ncbi:hypothetical protein GDO86_003990 [Hymenochirus boettgeri]|uniref:ZZ-type domain-containing protein n=1 Tax=Hymenochirus boettgeri TaxID=247094 RepID=A0A8T2K3F8_9PIPI|nr:hypothetical protein GDO86_003990 [Hymenochirus boettgeri]
MLELKQKSLHANGDKVCLDVIETNPENLAKECIKKSLLLLLFSPVTSKLSFDSYHLGENTHIINCPECRRNSSFAESDFQASTGSPETVHPVFMAQVQATDAGSQKKQQSELFRETQSVSQTKNLEKAEDSTSPPPTPTRKVPFTRAKLRLMSFRSMEETRLVPNVKEKYPILKTILDFIKDPALSQECIFHVHFLRKTQAESILKVLRIIQECLQSLGQPHFFQPPCILFILELLACQTDFSNYFGHLEGCGAELHSAVRESYFRLVLLLVKAVKSFSSIDDRSLHPGLSCIQTALLHMLDMSWETIDLSFFLSIDLPDLLFSMSQENISTYDSTVSLLDEEDQRADYRQNLLWLDECKDGMFETWYEKISQADPDVKRKMHMFIARYCDLLNVEISCDGCNKIAPWHRYRCLQCNDMDLCKACFRGGVKPEGHEDDHEMINMEYACDHCQGLIVGHRINCNECDNFNLCYGCYLGMRYPESHLPTHNVIVHPMVTYHLSDRQRLIQLYIHNYSWLLFSALYLYCSDLASEGEIEEEKLDDNVISSARRLQANCTDLVVSSLMKTQKGKGLRMSSLLSMWSHTKLCLSENETCSVNSFIEDLRKIEDFPCHLVDKAKLVVDKSKDVDDKDIANVCKSMGDAKQRDLLQDNDGKITEKATEMCLVTENKSRKSTISKAVIPSPDQVFAECSQERILGLIAATLPPLKLGSLVSIQNLQQVLPLMFQVVFSNAGHLNESYHLTLGLLGQLIIRLPPSDVDAAVNKVFSHMQNIPAPFDDRTMQEGWVTTHLLFSLGALCLDSKVGLDWACTMSDILRELNGSPQWHSVISSFADHCIKLLPQHLNNTSIFTLLVLVGFPEVLCMGTHSVYVDNAKEPHDVIVLKHFTEKNRAVIVDVKTRKRKTVKDFQLIQQSDAERGGLKDQFKKYLQHFAFISSQLLQSNLDNSIADAVEATWVLSLSLKGLFKTLKNQCFEELQTAFINSGLLKLLVKKCSKGTGFSKTWLLRDLEILSIMLYSSKKESTTMSDGSTSEKKVQDKDLDLSSHSTVDLVQVMSDPLEDLDESTKLCFEKLHKELKAPLHILRAVYEMEMRSTESFVQEVHKRFDKNADVIDEKVKKLAQKWQPCKTNVEEQSLKSMDTDMIIQPCMLKPMVCEKAKEESSPVNQKLIVTSESDLQQSFARQRRTKSSALFRKELDSHRKVAVRDYLFTVNEATTVIYARHVLASLLAEWPDGIPLNEDILELSGPAHITYILNMLMNLEEKQLWEKILQKVLGGCSGSMLATVALTACQFMEEPGTAIQVRESKHPYNNNAIFEDKVHIPGAIYLSIKFDPLCNTEEGCDELVMSSSPDFKQDQHRFSGPPKKWIDFELPGDTLFLPITSDNELH